MQHSCILTNMKLIWGLDDLARLLCLNLQVCCADWGDSTKHAFTLGPWLKGEKIQRKLSPRWWQKHRWERERKHSQGLKTYTQIQHIVTSTHTPSDKVTWRSSASRGRCTLYTQWGHKNGGRQRKVKNWHQWFNPPQVPNPTVWQAKQDS